MPWSRTDALGRVARHVGVAAHELVDVLEALVVAHVEGDAPIGRDRQRRPFVLESAHRGALDRLAGRVEGIDLHHPPEPVWLIRMQGGVEALVELVPAVAEAAVVEPVALLERGQAAGPVDEIGVEVLLAREVRAPRGTATRAVVDGAERGPAGRIGGGPEPGMAGGGPPECDRGGRGDPARVPRRADHDPPVAVEADLDHRHAVGGLRLPDLVGRPGIHAARMQQPVVRVFVVHGQEPVDRADLPGGEREEVHAVMVHPGLARLLGDAIARIRLERGPIRDRIAPGVEDLGDVAGRDDQGVGGRHRHARETQERGLRHRGAQAPEARHHPQQPKAGRREPAGHQAPAGHADLQHIVEGTVG